MSADILIASYLRIARQALNGALLLAPSGNHYAIYLCEQAAEQIIRAVLVSEKKDGGIGHRLSDMVDLVPDINPLKLQLRGIEDLAFYATTYRYPTPQGRIKSSPPPSEFAAYVQKIEAALAVAVSRFGVDLARKDHPAQNIGPIR